MHHLGVARSNLIFELIIDKIIENNRAEPREGPWERQDTQLITTKISVY